MEFICTQCGLGIQEHTGSICAYCLTLQKKILDKAQLKEILHYIYDKGICMYCGAYAAHKEHVVPKCLHLPTYIVPSCAECNLLAGDAPVASFIEKRTLIKKLLHRRYAEVLDTLPHSALELAELGPTLRNHIQGQLEAKQLVEQRLAFQAEWAFTLSNGFVEEITETPQLTAKIVSKPIKERPFKPKKRKPHYMTPLFSPKAYLSFE